MALPEATLRLWDAAGCAIRLEDERKKKDNEEDE